MKKRLWTILLTGAFILSLSACANSSPSDDTSSSASTVSTENAAEVTTSSTDKELTGEDLLKQTTKEEYLELLYPVLRDLGELNEVSSIMFSEIKSMEHKDSMAYWVDAEVTVGKRNLSVSYVASEGEVIVSSISDAEEIGHYYYLDENRGFFSTYDYSTDELLESGAFDKVLEKELLESEEGSTTSDTAYETAKQELYGIFLENPLEIKDITFNKDFTTINIYIDPLFKDSVSTGMAYLDIYDVCKEYRASSDNPDAEMTVYIYNNNTKELIDSGPIVMDGN